MITANGGANCESPMGEEIARNVETIDYVFSGPALLSFPALVESLLAGDAGGAERIDGVFTRANLAAASTGAPPVAPIGAELDIDEEVPLDYEPFLQSFETAFAGEEVEPTLMFETSRGCWWGERAHCTFCGLNGSTMSFRWMKPAKAVALIESLFAHFPRVRRFNCVDNIMPKEYPREVFARLATPPGASIFYEVKADLSEEDIALLSAAGVDGVQPGIEALDTSTLRLMRKGMTSVRNIAFLQHCMLHDVHPAWNLLVGFPGEGEEVYKRYFEIFHLLVHLPPPAGVFPVRFDRFSPYFTDAARHGLDLAPIDFYPLVYPFAPESLARLAYYFTDRNVKAPYFLAMARWIGRLYKVQGAWARSWDGGHPPVPALEPPGGRTVKDSRSGSAVVHDVGDGGRAAAGRPGRADDAGRARQGPLRPAARHRRRAGAAARPRPYFRGRRPADQPGAPPRCEPGAAAQPLRGAGGGAGMSLRELHQGLAGLTPEQRALFARRLAESGWGPQGPEILPRDGGGGAVPASLVQQRLWLLDQMEPGNPFYNLPLLCFRLRGRLDAATLER